MATSKPKMISKSVPSALLLSTPNVRAFNAQPITQATVGHHDRRSKLKIVASISHVILHRVIAMHVRATASSHIPMLRAMYAMSKNKHEHSAATSKKKENCHVLPCRVQLAKFDPEWNRVKKKVKKYSAQKHAVRTQEPIW